MAKTPSTKLFDLIHSLSKSEKRYFTLFASRHALGDGNKYLKMFKIIDQQERFDQEALRIDLYGETELKSKVFFEMCAYLYDLILRSLRSYHEGKSIRFFIKSQLQNVEILYNKSLFSQSREILKKAESLAEEYEEYGIMIEILNWYKRIAYAESDIPYIDKNIDSIHQKERETLKKQQELTEYWSLFYRIFVRVRTDAVLRNEERILKMQALMSNPLLADDYRPHSLQSNMLFDRIKSLNAYSSGDMQAFYDWNKQLFERAEKMKHFFVEDPSQYISILHNLVSACNYLRKYDEMQTYLDKFLAIKPVSQDDELKIVTEYYLNKLFFCNKSGDFAEGEVLIKESEQLHDKYKRSLFAVTFYSFYAYIYFGRQRYQEALVWLNRVTEEPGEREDLLCVARVLILLSHFELGNNMFLDYLLRSTSRYLKKDARLYRFEKAILRFVKKSESFLDKNEEKKAFKELRTTIIRLSDDPKEKVLLDYFDFVAWIDSHLEGKTIEEIVKVKFKG